ncbi:MAG: S1 family peptidase [Actinomycetota bacterium]
MSVIREKSSTLFGVILPRTVAGLAMWILLIGIGMAGSGVAFFAFYQYRTTALEGKIDKFAQQFDADAKRRTDEFTALVKESKAEIEKASRGITRQTNEVAALLGKTAPSIAYVLGQDLAGVPATASGFIVTSTADQTWVITNYRFVAGAAQKKVPVRIRIGANEQDGQVWSWDEARDLALVIIKTGKLPVLEWATGDPQLGSKVWAAGSSPGKLKAAAASGFVLDSAPDGLLVDADVPDSSLGGPVLNPDGKVLGVLTSNYAPVGYPPAKGWAVPIRLSCDKIIKCPAAAAPPPAVPPPAVPPAIP